MKSTAAVFVLDWYDDCNRISIFKPWHDIMGDYPCHYARFWWYFGMTVLLLCCIGIINLPIQFCQCLTWNTPSLYHAGDMWDKLKFIPHSTVWSARPGRSHSRHCQFSGLCIRCVTTCIHREDHFHSRACSDCLIRKCEARKPLSLAVTCHE